MNLKEYWGFYKIRIWKGARSLSGTCPSHLIWHDVRKSRFTCPRLYTYFHHDIWWRNQPVSETQCLRLADTINRVNDWSITIVRLNTASFVKSLPYLFTHWEIFLAEVYIQNAWNWQFTKSRYLTSLPTMLYYYKWMDGLLSSFKLSRCLCWCTIRVCFTLKIVPVLPNFVTIPNNTDIFQSRVTPILNWYHRFPMKMNVCDIFKK